MGEGEEWSNHSGESAGNGRVCVCVCVCVCVRERERERERGGGGGGEREIKCGARTECGQAAHSFIIVK